MNSRRISFIILEDVWYNNAYSNISINNHIKKYNMYKDESFIRELVFGVLENQLYIDYIIDKTSNIRRDRIHKNILTCLRLGIYQIIFMDNVPDRAAVHETVEIAKIYGNKGSIGYVNGILRNISRNKKKVCKIESKDKVEYLSIRYSHPRWLVEYFLKEFDYDFTKKLLIYNNKVPGFDIRINKLKAENEEIKEMLINKGYNVNKNKFAKNSFRIDNPVRILDKKEYIEGLYTIQDQSSTLVGDVLKPKPGSTVLDTCAAPGGKSTHLAEIMKNKGKVIARDIHNHRLNLIDGLANRLDIDIIETEKWNAREVDESLIGKIDYCLIDAPCSGLGTIRRSPEIKYRRNMEDLKNLSKIQLDILEKSKKYIKKNGYMVYSTCTIGSKENDEVIESFLEKNDNFILENIEIDNLEIEDKFIKLFPNVHDTDGFFIAKLKKID